MPRRGEGGPGRNGNGLLEITDLLWRADDNGIRLPVVKADVIARLLGCGQRRAARIVSRMPSPGGVLDRDYVDALGLRVHCELQRLSEELQFGRRVEGLLSLLVSGLRTAGPGLIRVVDLGCGLGYVLRSLAAASRLGPDVQLVGAAGPGLIRVVDLGCGLGYVLRSLAAILPTPPPQAGTVKRSP